MPTVFESISDGFYTAFYEPDPDKRKIKIDVQIQESTPVIQSAVGAELRLYVLDLLKDTWTAEGWKTRSEKFIEQTVNLGKKNIVPFVDAYRLYLEIKLRHSDSNIPETMVGPLTPEVRAKTLEAAEAAKKTITKLKPPTPIALREIDLHGNTVEQAIPMVDKFLKECYRDNVRGIRVIHGKGIFILQKAIREYLSRNKYIIFGSISPADKDHGGEGATEANLIDFSIDKLK